MKTSDFFTVESEYIKELFDSENTWDAIKNLPQFLEKLFAEGKIKGNYSENVYVEEGAKVDESARIIGPAYICKGAEIRFNAYIRENVFVGENSVIGHAAEIKNSLVLNNSSISHLNHVADSIIGNNVNIAGGAQIANLRLDKENIKVMIDGEKVDTGLKKLGAIIGDGSQIGANAVLNPGTILGKDCTVYPLTVVSHTHEANSVIKPPTLDSNH